VVTGVGTVGVLTAQPDFHNVVKTAILIDLPGTQVAVVVTQGHFGGIIVVQVLGCGGLQNEIAVVK
jgi:hypothetical protein